MQVNEEKRKKFMEYAGKRVNNVLHDIQILEPMSRSNSYDFTRQDVDEMFNAMQETLNNAKAEFEKKFDEKARSEKKTFSFGSTSTLTDTAFANVTNAEIDNATLVTNHDAESKGNSSDCYVNANTTKNDTTYAEVTKHSTDSTNSTESEAF